MGQIQRLVIAPSQFRSGQIVLTADQCHYLYDILRLRSGDSFIALDGQGQAWRAVLEPGAVGGARGHRGLEMATIATLTEPVPIAPGLSLPITLLAALPKGNAFDEVVRQVTELGVTRIVPVVSDRTLLRPSGQKLERWRRIALEATEQSERAITPTIMDPCPFLVALEQLRRESPRSIAAIGVARGEAVHLLNWLQGVTNPQLEAGVVVAVGPEGGWTKAEVAQAIAVGFVPVSLGRTLLRAVTATIAAVGLVSAVAQARELGGAVSPVYLEVTSASKEPIRIDRDRAG